MPTPPERCTVLADLRAGADRRPGVDHRALADIGAEIDEGRHQHHAGRDVGRAAHDAARHGAEAGLRGSGSSPQPSNFAAPCPTTTRRRARRRSTLMSLRRNDSSTAFLSHWLTCQLPSRLLLGDARLAAVEQVERGLDRLAHRAFGRRADRRRAPRRRRRWSWRVVVRHVAVHELSPLGCGLSGAGRRCQAAAQGRATMPRRKPVEIVGDVIDMRRVAAFQLPVLAEDFARGLPAPPAPWSCRARAALRDCARDPRTSPPCPDRRRGAQGNGRRSAAAASARDRPRRCRTRPRNARAIVEPLHHRLGVLARAVGEDELAAGQLLDRRAERRIGRRAANDRSGARSRGSRRVRRRARSSARAWWCRSAGNNPSARGTPRPCGTFRKSAM